jgi:hypothetical protein
MNENRSTRIFALALEIKAARWLAHPLMADEPLSKEEQRLQDKMDKLENQRLAKEAKVGVRALCLSAILQSRRTSRGLMTF